MDTSSKQGLGLVVDSVADLPPTLLKELGNIKIVPFHVYFQKENISYDDGVTLSYHQFYEKLEQPELGLPKTQGPNTGEYVAAYQEMLQRYDRLLSLHVSTKMSVAYNSATLAREMLPDADITLWDSGTVSMVLGLYTLQASRMAKAGKTPAEIIECLEKYRAETVQLFVADTLKYLRQSGRVNQAAYLIGQALHIKPIFTFKDGIGESAGRELSQERAFLRIAKTMAEKFGQRPLLATVVHSMAPQQAELLKNRITNNTNVQELIMAEMGPTLGAHGGAGVVGAAAFPLG
jgi:DegV family protein with EDD domain